MLISVIICMTMVGHLSMAVPLDNILTDDAPSSAVFGESPTSKLLLESPLDDTLSAEMLQENPLSDEAFSSAMLLESSLSDEALSSEMLVENPTSALLSEGHSPHFSQYFDSRIVGGVDAPHGSTPHMVALVVGWQYKFFTCGGAIIHCNFIATAAHCIPLDWQGNIIESFYAIVGTNTWNHGGKVVKIKSFTIHPHYDQAAIKNDIGLLRTTKRLDFGKNVKPISLEHKWVGGGVKCYMTGWGTQTLWGAVPDKLQIMFIKTISSKICKKMIEDIVGQGWAPPVDFEKEICTFRQVGIGACHGDSGSALVDYETGKQVGIVSWGWPCAIGAPDMFVRISAMIKFIKSVIGDHHCKK